MHPDGYIELRDRKKDIIISGGENISTIEVEQAICAHPAVLEAAVIATPDDYWGEVPKAFVTLKPRYEVSEEERASSAVSVLPASRYRKRSSSESYPKPRPAKCRSSSSGSENGRGTTSASTSTTRRATPASHAT